MYLELEVTMGDFDHLEAAEQKISVCQGNITRETVEDIRVPKSTVAVRG